MGDDAGTGSSKRLAVRKLIASSEGGVALGR
jgi:hypothetical protein